MSLQLPDDPLLGGRIGDWVLVERLGEGSLGTTYKGVGEDGAAVAVKIVEEGHLHEDEMFRPRFLREIGIAQRMLAGIDFSERPGLLPIVAFGEHDRLPYVIWPFVEGSSLAEKLAEAGPLDASEAVHICSDAASGLDALWSVGGVDRNLKPGNIHLDRDGRGFVGEFYPPAPPTVGWFPGCPDYCAPEEIRGEPIRQTANVYSLGCVMFECVCGRPPFMADDELHLLSAHLNTAPPDPRDFRADVTPAFARALLRALQKEPGNRPQTAGEYARELAGAL